MGNSAISPAIFYDACQRGDLTQLETILSHQKLTPVEKEKFFNHRVEEMPKMFSTPLFTAIQNHHLPVVQLLLVHGINPNTRLQTLVGCKDTALMHAISWRDAMIVDVLLRYHAQVNAVDETSGKTALHRVCGLRESALAHTSSVIDLVNVMIKYHADWTIADKNGNLPLHCACFVGNLPLIEHLLSSENTRKIILQQLDSPNKMAKTPLMIACEHNHAALVSLLLKEGANPFLALAVRVDQSNNINSSRSKKAQGKSIFLTSQSSTNNQTINQQQQKKRPHKKTALCWAVENNHEDIVRLLLAHHKDMFTCNNNSNDISNIHNYNNKESNSVYPLNQLRNRSTKSNNNLDDTCTDNLTTSSSSVTHNNASNKGKPSFNNNDKFQSYSYGYGSDDDEEDAFLSDDEDDFLANDAGINTNANHHVSYFAFHHITHLVGCCLLEAILLGEVTIAQLLLEHVHEYFQFHAPPTFSAHKSNNSSTELMDSSLKKMYNRAFMLACQARHRDMVHMLLRHLQAIGLPLKTMLQNNNKNSDNNNSNSNKYEQYEELFVKAAQDAVIVSLIQQFVDQAQ